MAVNSIRLPIMVCNLLEKVVKFNKDPPVARVLRLLL
jgi:hypothetical protein